MLRGTQSPARPSALLAILALLALAAAFAACGTEAPSGLKDLSQPLFKGKPLPDPVTVDDFNPKDGEQGQTFPMTVTGSGFGNGAKVVFVLDGEDVSTISTTTTSVDPTTLTADISIDAEAVVSFDYEVAVAFRRGSRGVATERFEVKVAPNPQSGHPKYRADLYVNSDMDFMDDGDPAYVDGKQRFQAVTASDGNAFTANFAKVLRKRIRRGWIRLGCMHPADADRNDHTQDIGPSGNPCSLNDYEIVEVTDIKAWLADDYNAETGQVFFFVERDVDVSRCEGWGVSPTLRFDADPRAPDPPTPWLADWLVVDDPIEDPNPSTIRKRRVHTTPDANLAWCQNGYTGAHEFWHVDVDFFVIEHE
jgi:hypothetical protein